MFNGISYSRSFRIEGWGWHSYVGSAVEVFLPIALRLIPLCYYLSSLLTAKWVNISTVLYNPTAFFAKTSILLQYSRIFNPTGIKDLPMFFAVRIGIFGVFVFYFMGIFFVIFECDPREKIWNLFITTGHCYNGNAIYKASGIFNVLSDFAILIIPMPSIWKLNMSLRRKLLITGVFASGFL